jgi:Plavaka transposase
VETYDPYDPEQHPWQAEPPVGWESEHVTMSFADLIDSDTMELTDTEIPNTLGPAHSPTSYTMPVETDTGANTSDTESYTQPFPHPAGVILSEAATWLEHVHKHKEGNNQSVYHPFIDQDEWELAEMLMTSGMSQSKIDKLLKLPIVSAGACETIWRPNCLQMTNWGHSSFKDKRTLLNKVDSLPLAGPEFKCEAVTVQGDLKNINDEYITEELDLFYRDPVECVQALLSNPSFHQVLHYAPE